MGWVSRFLSVGWLIGSALSPVQAQWVSFTPCGQEMPDENTERERFVGPSPHIGPLWVWTPAVQAVVGFKEPITVKVDCSYLVLYYHRHLVIGSTREVLNKLTR